MTSPSPSTIATIRRGMPNRWAIEVAASGSVGETTAPSTNADDHGRPLTAECATQATPAVVHSTRPVESRPIGRLLARRSRSDVKNAAE